MGLSHPPPGDKREVVDTTYTVDPDKGSKIIFDDRALEAERMTAFISANSSSLLQRTQIGTELTEARQLLLPRGVWAYVFRNRKWCMYLSPLTSLYRYADKNKPSSM